MKKRTIKWIACFLAIVLISVVIAFEIVSYHDFRQEMSETEKVFGIIFGILSMPAIYWLWEKTEKYEEEAKEK